MNHEAGRTQTPLPDLPCPYCSAKLECASGLSANLNAMPTAGAAAVCVACAQPSVFVDGPFGMALRKPTKDERASIMAQIGPALMLFNMMKKR